MYLCSQAFRGSESYANIKNRCAFLFDVVEPSVRIVTNKDNAGEFEQLVKLGILYNGLFVSPLMSNEVLDNMPPPENVEVMRLDRSRGIESCVEQIICAGFRFHYAEDFMDIKPGILAVENSMSLKWSSSIIHTFPTLAISYQARTVYDDHSRPCAKPLIDFVFNGGLQLGLEVALNVDANSLKEHLQRFDSKYKPFKENCVVMHVVDTKRSEPIEINSLDKGSKDRIYTFHTRRNALYRGSVLIRSQVSENLMSPYQFPESENASKKKN